MRGTFKVKIHDMNLEVIYEVLEPVFRGNRIDPSDPFEIDLEQVLDLDGGNMITATLNTNVEEDLKKLALEHYFETR